MKITFLAAYLALSTVAFLPAQTMEKPAALPSPPIAKKIPKKMEAHGDVRVDNYYWMNERENPEVIAYLTAENAYREAKMKHTEGFQKKLFEEIKGRIKQNDQSLPYKDNGYFYYTRFEEGKQYPIYCRKKGSLEAAEEVMLNGNEMSKGYKYFQVGGATVSPDNKILAYGVDTVSRRQYTIYFKNLETGELLSDKIALTTGGCSWANDNKTVFYNQTNPVTLRSERVKKHKLSQTGDDVEVYFEKDETFNCFAYKTKSDKFIMIGSGSTLSNEYQFVDADTPDAPFTMLQARERGLEYSVDHYGDQFYIVTNKDGAKNFQLMTTPLSKTGKDNWKTMIPNRTDVYLAGIEIFKNHLVVSERKNGLRQLRIMNNATKEEHYLDFGEAAYVAAVSVNPDFETSTLRFSYQSMTTPNSTFDYDMNAKTKKLMKQTEVLGGFKTEDYATERIYATAKDGTKVPISLVFKKSLFKKDGKSPLLVYGYGSYGNSTEPSFSTGRLSLLDRGFVYAIAHVRGGQEMGRQWYEDGKMFNKKNSFTDFIECTEYLTDQKYGDKEKVFANGGSAGGLLMGAVATMRPDLWRGVVADVPFVDVVTTMLDETIPLTTGEFDEWGNPKNKESYFYMKSYSPYDQADQLATKKMPPMLITTGLHDSQVQYYEPTKWIAKLRDVTPNQNSLYLFCNMTTGHGGASGRFDALKDVAMRYAFIFDQLGIKE
jgi:oligopeptidase B